MLHVASLLNRFGGVSSGSDSDSILWACLKRLEVVVGGLDTSKL
jgi:hypothetical protein